jgi:hypothetical protein
MQPFSMHRALSGRRADGSGASGGGPGNCASGLGGHAEDNSAQARSSFKPAGSAGVLGGFICRGSPLPLCVPAMGRPFFSFRFAGVGRGDARGFLGAVAVKDSKDMPGEGRYSVPGQGSNRRCGASSSSLQPRRVEKPFGSSQPSAPDQNPFVLETLSSIDSVSIARRTDGDDFPHPAEGRRTGLKKCPECSSSAPRGRTHFGAFARFTDAVALGKKRTRFPRATEQEFRTSRMKRLPTAIEIRPETNKICRGSTILAVFRRFGSAGRAIEGLRPPVKNRSTSAPWPEVPKGGSTESRVRTLSLALSSKSGIC